MSQFEMKCLSANYACNWKFRYMSNISKLQKKRKNATYPLKWQRGNYVMPGFEQLRLQQGADVIAVAHHKDDSVETLLLNLIRGTGINGLLGIRPKNGNIVRPLLCLDRKEITEYLQEIGQSYVTDSTNLQDEYTRNKIRLSLLPLMQEINPSIKRKPSPHLRTSE